MNNILDQLNDPNNRFNTNKYIADILNILRNLSQVATSGSYNDLLNKPTIPTAQVNSDWNATEGVALILNKPNLYKPFVGQILHGQLANSDFDGFLKWTDGRALSKTTYALLWDWATNSSLIGVEGTAGKFFADTNATTFTLHGMSGRAVIGTGQGLGLTNRDLGAKLGAETHTLTVSQLPSIAPNIKAADNDKSDSTSQGFPLNDIHNSFRTSDRAGTNRANLIESFGGGQPHPNMPPSVALNIFIYSGL